MERTISLLYWAKDTPGVSLALLNYADVSLCVCLVVGGYCFNCVTLEHKHRFMYRMSDHIWRADMKLATAFGETF